MVGAAWPALAPTAPARRHALGAGAGLEVSPHTLRHTAATRWLRAGVDVVVVAGLLGHSSLDTTRTYTNPRELHLTGEKPQVAC